VRSHYDICNLINQGQTSIQLEEWIENRARSIEALERRPHNALAIISLLSTSISSENSTRQRDLQAFQPSTPSFYVQNTILTSHLSTKPSSEPRALNSRQSTSTLKSQLEDLVYLWVS
jgi:hypothetical protein